MRTFKKFFIAALICTSHSAFAQTFDITKTTVEVDGKPYLKKSKCGVLANECSLKNLNDKEIIYIQSLMVPGSKFTYNKVVFLGTGKFIETSDGIKSLIKSFYKNNIVNENGELNKEAVEIMVEKIGHSITHQP